MNRSILRAALFAVGGALLAGAAVSAFSGCTVGTVLRLAVPGLVLLFGLSVEHWRYKPVSARTPGQGWVATNERFFDPESGELVTVYYRPSTGERRYVSG